VNAGAHVLTNKFFFCCPVTEVFSFGKNEFKGIVHVYGLSIIQSKLSERRIQNLQPIFNVFYVPTTTTMPRQTCIVGFNLTLSQKLNLDLVV